MKHALSPANLDVRAFALASGQLAGELALSDLPRVAAECAGGDASGVVAWSARGETRQGGKGEPQSWLYLSAQCVVPMLCQRCLERVQTPLVVDRWFRFVEDEASALAQDDACEEDLLVDDGAFRMQTLIEDELVLELPHIPRHQVCPAQRAAAADSVTSAPERRHPFAALAGFKPRQP